MSRRDACGACGSDELHLFLDLGQSPIADAYTTTADEVSKTYPLQAAVCAECKLVQLLEVIDSTTLFGTGYSFYSSASPPLSAYHRAYAEEVLDGHPDLARRGVLEIGCNDGDMLRWFDDAGCPALGIDPAAGPVGVATRRKLNVVQAEFTEAEAERLHGKLTEPAGVVIANHVLAHVADVGDVLRGVSTILADDGVAYVEVQYLPDMLVNNAFDVVYHEHRNFFSLTSLALAAQRAALRVVDARLTRRQGGSLRAVLRQRAATRSTDVAARVHGVMESEWWLNAGLQAYDGVQGRVERIRARLRDLLWTEVRRSRWEGVPNVVAGYGAPAKATTLLNYCGVDSTELEFIVDSTPAKWDRYVPGTGIRIVSPAAVLGRPLPQPNVYLLLAWNYADEIVRREPRDVRWIVPLPAPLTL